MTAFWKRQKKDGKKGGPIAIDCCGVMERLYEYIDEELDDGTLVEAIRAHLDMCKACYPRYDFEKAFLRFLSDKGANSAPPELRRKIFARLLEEESRS